MREREEEAHHAHAQRLPESVVVGELVHEWKDSTQQFLGTQKLKNVLATGMLLLSLSLSLLEHNANNNNNNNCGDCWVDNRATCQACSSGGGVHDCQQHLLRNLSHPSPCQGSSGGGGDYDSTPPTPDLSTQQDESVTPSAAPLHLLP